MILKFLKNLLLVNHNFRDFQNLTSVKFIF